MITIRYQITLNSYVQYYIVEGDTIPKDAIDLEEVVLLGKIKLMIS